MVIIPVGFAIVYTISLCGRVKKDNDVLQDQRIEDQARDAGILPGRPNRVLSDQIIETARLRFDVDNNDEFSTGRYIRQIVNSEGFLQDPILHMINLIIERGVDGASLTDSARAFIITQIPDFLDKIGSMEYLKSVAEIRYRDMGNKNEILNTFNASIEDPLFQNDLRSFINGLRQRMQENNNFESICRLEHELRIVFQIYQYSQALHRYQRPAYILE